jgi:indolepyruvate ferredoxin oxidoreductase
MLKSVASAHGFALDDKYRLDTGGMYLNGTQALVRLLLLQHRRDRAQGLKTAGFVSGYRGSPLGGFDRELWRAQRFLRDNQIEFWPGINEDLAATAVWGSQMLGYQGKPAVAGVFGMWYGKGAGLDRSGDAIRHANASGVHPHGGVLAVVGDDHAQKSSTQPYFCEPTCADLLLPVLYPSSVSELIEYGLLGWALSRYSGAWVALKTLAEVLDCSISLQERAFELRIETPAAGRPPAGSAHFRWPDPWNRAERIWIEHRLPAIQAFARANPIDRIALRSPRRRLGIVTAGKSFGDVLQALAELGVSLDQAAELGLEIYKVGMTWPLELTGLRAFAAGLAELLIIEEKRPVLEDQIKSALYGDLARPRITGKQDEHGAWQFPWVGELDAGRIARVLASKLPELGQRPAAQAHLAALEQAEQRVSVGRPRLARPPYFCSGCPHNTSTRVPEGSRAIAGVGCHYMAADMERETATFSQMGGEGATWIGQAAFTEQQHVFVNLGEGTYYHSGSLAVRACIAARVNITYKLLYNDAVAMTGGQPVDGELSVEALAHQLYAEGIRSIQIVAEQPEKYSDAARLPAGTKVHPRSQLDAVQRMLREIPGVTALIYDQTCAAEKRRRRKRKQFPAAAQRAFINAAVCEGCGDCSKASNCLSVVPIETELGRKRAIDQSSCNQDLSCVDGFCPSFVTVTGRQPVRAALPNAAAPVPDPVIPTLDGVYDIFITGVGGTGVVTVGALLGVAAHIEAKACSVLDQLGMAQKGGAVVSHLRIASDAAYLHAARVPSTGANLLLGFDLAVTLQDSAVDKISPGHTQVILNTHETITGAFTRNTELRQPTAEMVAVLERMAGESRVAAFDAVGVAVKYLGDSIASNLLVVGYAFQRGLIPLSRESILEAIRLNGVEVEFNCRAFELGRRVAVDPTVLPGANSQARADATLSSLIERNVVFLTAYQDQRYADVYRSFVERVLEVERSRCPGQEMLTRTVAEALFKLMAYKDEYEVARLYTDGGFRRSLEETFGPGARVRFHLAPPLLAARHPRTGHLMKRAYGPWMYHAFRMLAALKRLRGTRLDLFGYTEERRMERQLIVDYRRAIERVLVELSPGNHALALHVAGASLQIRGYGHVKQRSVARVAEEQSRLLEKLTAGEH